MYISILVDVVVLIVLVISAIVGYKKGFIKYFLGTLGTIAIIAVSFLASGVLTNTVYDKFVKPSVVDYVNDKIEKVSVEKIVSEELKKSGYNINLSESQLSALLKSDGDISEEISRLAGQYGIGQTQMNQLNDQLDDFFENRFVGKLGSLFSGFDTKKLGESNDYSKTMAYDTARALAKDDTKTAAGYLEKNMVRPVALVFVRIALFVLLYILLFIAMKIVVKVSGIMDHIPVANTANKVLGVLGGLVKGFICIAFVSYLAELLISASGDSLNNFNNQIIDKTFLFKYIFNFINQ